jgi:HEAT repeat protein
VDDDSAVRYWAALGILMRGKKGVEAAHDELQAALKDRSPYLRIVAAEALGQYGSEADRKQGLPVLVELANAEDNSVFVAMASLNALDALDGKVSPVADEIKKLPQKGKVPDARYAPFVPTLLKHLRA